MQSLRNKVKDWFKCQMAVIASCSAVAVDFIAKVPCKTRLQNALQSSKTIILTKMVKLNKAAW